MIITFLFPCICKFTDNKRKSPTSCIKAHTEEVCDLKWSFEGGVLASGGNESFIYMWEASKMSSLNFLGRLNAQSTC